MFGYIRVDRPELKVREYEAYRGAYCGLCRAMGKCTGCASRMTLSYDFAFLLLLRLVLTETPCETEMKRCFVHPFHKRPTLKRNAQSDYVACAAAILSYYKCKDDLADETGKKKLRARFFSVTAASMRRRALKRDPALAALDGRIRDAMARISAAEREKTPSVDLYAELSGEMLAEIFSFGLDEAEARIARSIGRHIGKWVYLTDAYDDLREDSERERFNPYLVLWETDADAAVWEERREMIRVALLSELSEAENGVDLMDFSDYPDFCGVIRNILYRGMPKTADTVLSEENKQKNKKRGSTARMGKE
ncbi:MAG: hypothetical protein J6B77_05905 [Clostridia bacterium]|nr:hypothetical protein [Clostridia bacterium]